MKQHFRIFLLCIFAAVFSSTLYADDFANLKGKRIVIADYNMNWTMTFPLGSTQHTIGDKLKYKLYVNDGSQKLKKSYTGNIIGLPILVEDVVYITSSKGTIKEMRLFLKSSSDDIVFSVPLGQTYSGGLNYKIKRTLSPDDVHINCFDYDELSSYAAEKTGKQFYIDKEKGRKTFNGIEIESGKLWFTYSQGDSLGKYQLLPQTTNSSSSNNKFEYFRDYCAKWEDQLIEDAKSKADTLYISSLNKQFGGKEIILNGNGSAPVFFQEIKLDNDDYADSYRYIMFLKNSDGKVIKNSLIPEKQNIILAEDFRKNEQLKQEEQERIEKKNAKQLAQEEAAYKAKLIRKYGKRKASIILEERVEIGFTKEMCIEAWGEPYDINRTITKYGTHEQWVYGSGSYLYFDGNTLTAIQN